MASNEEDDAVHGDDIMDISTDESQAKEAHDRDYAQISESLVDVKDTNTNEAPGLKSTSDSSDVVDIMEVWSSEMSDHNSSQSNTNARPNGRQGHDALDEKLSNDDDGSSHSNTTEEKQGPGRTRDEVDELNDEGDHRYILIPMGDDAGNETICWEADSGEQKSVQSHDEVDESNLKDEEDDDVSEDNKEEEEEEEEDDVDDDDNNSHSSEDVPRKPGRRTKQVSTTFNEDDESNAQDEEGKDREEEGDYDDDDDDDNSNHLEKGARRKLGRPRKQEPLRGKRKRGRPRKEKTPTLDRDADDDDYQGGRPSKMLKEMNSKGGSPRKMLMETKIKRGRPRKIDKGTKSDGRRTTKMSKATTRSPVALTKAKYALIFAKPEEELRREPGTDIGSTVYAKWMNGSYYWAVIVDIKRKKSSHFDQYSLQFYDGDFLEYVSRNNFDTEEEVLAICEQRPPPMPNKISQMVKAKAKPASLQSCSLRELYNRRCKHCIHCRKPDCGECSTCMSDTQAVKGKRQVCLQKMCINIPVHRKEQPAVGLPAGWTFIFEEEKKFLNPKKTFIPGLWIFHPKTKKPFRSVEAAISLVPKILEANPHAVHDFYKHVGINLKQISGSLESQKPSVTTSRLHAVSSSMSLEDLLKSKCGKCLNCVKDDCRRCSSCVLYSNSKVCIQKVSLEDKAQPMPPGAKFPVGWKFVIDPTMEGYQSRWAPMKGAEGLKILSPTGAYCFYSVEQAKADHFIILKDVCARSFYIHIGTFATHGSRLASGSSESNSDVSNEDMRPEERCGECENCTKDACGRCSRCRSHHLGRSRDCYQKMCFAMSIRAKAEPAEGFPHGWRFYFAEDRRYFGRYEAIPCLSLISPGGKPFRSVEAAVGGSRLGHCDKISREFYRHVGVDCVAEPKTQEGKQNLSNYRVVGSRVYCQSGNVKWSWGNIEAKFEIRPHRFIYSVRLENDNSLIENLDEKCIQSEVLYKSKIGKEPPMPLGRHQIEHDSEDEWIGEDPHEEQKTEALCIGKIKTTTDHFLVGRGFYLAWTDLTGQNKMVYGEVTECEKNMRSRKVIRFRVTYSSKSRRELDDIGNGCGLVLPESQMLPTALVVGGCVLLEKQRGVACAGRLLTSNHLLPFYWSWITPMRRHEELVDSGNGMRLPRLTLLWQGFRLALNVKTSTIPNAGYGVFLSCTSLMQDAEPEYFELKPGELIDLGIYGPLQIQDQKLEAIFFVKNFVHSHKCDVFTFDAGDTRYQLDITDDVSGELHSVARSHVLAYVNESNVECSITINAEHDPEGSVHYLLGHANQSQGSFVVPADGSEVEVFVNYGSSYENVRIRKGYSFVSHEERGRVMDILSHEDADDLKEMDRFGEAEIEACVKFLWTLFSTEEESQFTSEVIERALTCAVVLQRRAQHKLVKQVQRAQNVNGGSTIEASTVDLKKVLKESRLVVSVLLGMAREEQDSLKMLQNAGKFDELLKRLFQRRFSCEELLAFDQDIFK